MFQLYYNTTGIVTVHLLAEATGSSSVRITRSIQLFFICPSAIARTPRITCPSPPPPPLSALPHSDLLGQASTRYAADFSCAADASARFPDSKGALLIGGMVQRLQGNWGGALVAYAAAASDEEQARDELPELLKAWVDAQLIELQELQQQQKQQQQQQPYAWKRTRSVSQLSPPGGDGRTYISIVMVGRHDNTQVMYPQNQGCTLLMSLSSSVSTHLMPAWIAQGYAHYSNAQLLESPPPPKASSPIIFRS